MQLIRFVNRYDLHAAFAQEIHKRQVFFPELIILSCSTCVNIARHIFRLSFGCFQPAAHHRTEVAVDDIEIGVEMHLHLPELMVPHDHHGVMSESIGVHQLTDAFYIRTHTTPDKGKGSCGEIVSPFQSAVTMYAEDRTQTEMTVTDLDDIRFRSTLSGIHITYDMASRRGYTLVAGEIEVHQRVLYILRLITGVIVRFGELDGWLEKNTTNQVRSTHFRQHLLPVRFRSGSILIGNRTDIIYQHFVRECTQGIHANRLKDIRHGMHTNAVFLQHTDIATVLRSCQIHIKIIFKESGRRVNNAVKQLLSGRMHQYIPGFAPFRPRVIHAALRIRHLLRHHIRSHPKSC